MLESEDREANTRKDSDQDTEPLNRENCQGVHYYRGIWVLRSSETDDSEDFDTIIFKGILSLTIVADIVLK